MAQKLKPSDTFRIVVNGHELMGEKHRRGGWRYRCESWPELAEQYNFNGSSMPHLIGEFTKLALADAINVKVALASMQWL